MIYQCKIPCKEYFLNARINMPTTFDRIVLLLPGFSHSKSDIDFFLTNLSSMLYERDFLTVQVDPYGHGDSYGELKDFTLGKLASGILNTVEWISQEFGSKIFLFTRGLFEMQVGNLFIDSKIGGVINLNPVIFSNSQYDRLMIGVLNVINDDNYGKVEFADWINSMIGGDRALCETFFYTLGAEMKNIMGQVIDFNFILDVITKFRQRENSNECNKNITIISRSIDECIMNRRNISYEHENAFSRDPEWQYYIINTIVNEFDRFSKAN